MHIKRPRHKFRSHNPQTPNPLPYPTPPLLPPHTADTSCHCQVKSQLSMVPVYLRLHLELRAAELVAVASVECVAGMLVHNYRSHRRLLELPSRLYYNNQLMASADPKLVTAPIWNELQKPDRSAVYFRSLHPVPFVPLATLDSRDPVLLAAA